MASDARPSWLREASKWRSREHAPSGARVVTLLSAMESDSRWTSEDSPSSLTSPLDARWTIRSVACTSWTGKEDKYGLRFAIRATSVSFLVLNESRLPTRV